ncbi:hypothetical protein [Flavobacterium geliluteum]|uniref:Uncharacterized protein n=1 Tax=Flavobacterium geliluteum TaxID=2816120 RepID=A0A940XD13_9FLAO|nr:hypothetical protein [Flavobacterium geliluteum]MBP4137429.1 hypothetical protein [Flavobacterium geliluteum]
MCECLNEIRQNIIENEKASYVRIDCSNIRRTTEGEADKECLTGQRIEIGYNHIKRDGEIKKKERKSFVTHDYCPFCGDKY